MKIRTMVPAAIGWVLLLAGAVPAQEQKDIGAAFWSAAQWEVGQDRLALAEIEDAVVAALGEEAARSELEGRFVDLLRDRDSTRGAKDFACRQLAVLGTSRCVPDLARLLEDEMLSHMARHALQVIPDPEAGAALVGALAFTRGARRIGIIGSLGERRETAAVPALREMLPVLPPAERDAALVALGNIGSAEAFDLIVGRMTRESMVQSSAYRCAFFRAIEHRLAEGGGRDLLAVAMLCQRLVEQGESVVVRAAALEALGRVSPRIAARFALDLLEDDDRSVRALAEGTLIAMSGVTVDRDLGARLARSDDPEEIITLLAIIESRGAAEAGPFVAPFLEDAREEVAEAALQTIGVVGGPANVPTLVRSAAADRAGAAAARVEMRAPGVNERLADLIGAASETERVVVANALGDRRAAAQRPALIDLTDDEEPAAVRTAALLALADLERADRPEAIAAAIVTAAQVAADPASRRAVLRALRDRNEYRQLPLALKWVDDPAIGREAAEVALALARTVEADRADEAIAAIERIASSYESDEAIRALAGDALSHVERNVGFVTAWAVSGPYLREGVDGGGLFGVAFPPEPGVPGPAEQWTVLSEGDLDQPGIVDLKRLLGGDHRTAYLATTVHSDREQPVRLELGSDDGVRVWLNDELVHVADVMRGLTPGQDVVQVTLREGPNRLLLKITQGGGDWRACCRVRDADGFRVSGVTFSAPE